MWNHDKATNFTPEIVLGADHNRPGLDGKPNPMRCLQERFDFHAVEHALGVCNIFRGHGSLGNDLPSTADDEPRTFRRFAVPEGNVANIVSLDVECIDEAEVVVVLIVVCSDRGVGDERYGVRRGNSRKFIPRT
jgi:hypothetical protein